MFEIGSSLREARLHQGLELARVEAELRIRSRYLAALEEERFELLPEGVYAKGFLRSYAEFLGLDSTLFLDEYNARFEKKDQLPSLPAQRPMRRPRALRPRLVAVAAIVVVAVVGLLILGLVQGSHPQRHAAPTRPSASAPAQTQKPVRRRPPARRPARPAAPVSMRAIGAWDPYGDRQEHDFEASAATDGNPATYWRTETYAAGLQKPGVGLLLDAAHPVRLRRLIVTTDTPGYTALIEAGPAASGPFRPISSARIIAAKSTFSLHAGAERYYLVWITRLDHIAHVNELRAFGR